jgi:hypothetical protein
MIHYLVTEPFTHTMQAFLQHWGGDLRAKIRIVTYDAAAESRELPIGTYIFSDLERLLPSERRIAEVIWSRLEAAGAKLLNHPTRTLMRYELLTRLHELGRNRFRVARATERVNHLRFPVFLRVENDHLGSLSDLIRDPRKLDETITGARLRGYLAKDMLVVEYVDVSDEKGLFRKYAAFKVGDRILPCHIDCSRRWVVKDNDIVDEGTVRDEMRYLETNPHRAWLEETFAIARVDYGRIDYAVDRDGNLQVWEINTNPIVINPPSRYMPIHMQVKELFAARVRPAFGEIDFDGTAKSVAIEIPRELLRESVREKARRDRNLARRDFVWHALRKRPVMQVRRVLKPIWAPFAPLVSRWMRSKHGSNVFLVNWLACVTAFGDSALLL